MGRFIRQNSIGCLPSDISMRQTMTNQLYEQTVLQVYGLVDKMGNTLIVRMLPECRTLLSMRQSVRIPSDETKCSNTIRWEKVFEYHQMGQSVRIPSDGTKYSNTTTWDKVFEYHQIRQSVRIPSDETKCSNTIRWDKVSEYHQMGQSVRVPSDKTKCLNTTRWNRSD